MSIKSACLTRQTQFCNTISCPFLVKVVPITTPNIIPVRTKGDLAIVGVSRILGTHWSLIFFGVPDSGK
jgi:hypothetical protein